MPRPGPRPYECVKRAWHSDRHQPIRGSVIQQIFRVVNETHSPLTKKNKEWQEKLPVVVLKAEEIMYSKANSEAEYINLDTLWDRVNDAVNTIIRREENTETGELLPPCVEAALNLGCIPVRASRSQRHRIPRSYLSPRANDTPQRIPHRATDEGCHQAFPIHTGKQNYSIRTSKEVDPSFQVSECSMDVKESIDTFAARNYHFSSENPPTGPNQLMTAETNNPLHMGSVYPLYYGTFHQTEESRFSSRAPEISNSNTILFGTPIGTSVADPAAEMVMQDFFPCAGNEFASSRTMKEDYQESSDKPPQTECDLSLRLSLLSEPCLVVGKDLACEVEDSGFSRCQVAGNSSDLSQLKRKEVCFFQRKIVNDPLDSCSNRWGEHQNMVDTFRKRKVPFGTNAEEGPLYWQPEHQSDPSIGHINRPDRNCG